MPILEPNLDEVESTKIADGTYPARITAANPEQSKSGNQMIVLDVAVLVDGREIPRKAWIVTSGKGAFQFPRLLRACKMDDLAARYEAKEKIPFDTDVLVGQNLQATIATEMYNGEERDKISGFLPTA